MHELRLPAAALVVLLALPAHAQSDVLCSSLDKLMASAAGPAPFAKLGAEFADTQAVTTLNDRLPGIEADTCVARMPASANRSGAAEGEFWEFNCTLYSASTRNNPDARAEAHYSDYVKIEPALPAALPRALPPRDPGRCDRNVGGY